MGKKKKKKTGLDIIRQWDKEKAERTERNRQRAIEQYTPILEEMGIDMNNVTFEPYPDKLSEIDKFH
ncbi:hypothetical protein [Okeania sp. SIO1I7]|uniref:hypothetical protein n=1 Tax=Okeania sp. SIO1I7 TaxID=2607772 RepID=UPI0013F9FA2F|nr:hypothetical protein [Okeania sp. SIO1I7]NET30253.1 hypothetical protein [Okeania sp. SIO1I7]